MRAFTVSPASVAACASPRCASGYRTERGIPAAVIEDRLKLGCSFRAFVESQISLAAKVLRPESADRLVAMRGFQQLNCLRGIAAVQLDQSAFQRRVDRVRQSTIGKSL